jgi:hypothetical protein
VSDCGKCFKCREGRGCIHSVTIAAAATPNRRPETNRINRTDAQWDKDMPAYKRMRMNGVQPPRIDDCAHLEREATSQFEVEMGRLAPKHLHSRIQEGLAISKELEAPAVGTRPAGG